MVSRAISRARHTGTSPASTRCPQAREPVGELESVGDQLAGGVVGDPKRGGEVGGCELRDPRSAGTGQRGQVLAVQVGLAPVRR